MQIQFATFSVINYVWGTINSHYQSAQQQLLVKSYCRLLSLQPPDHPASLWWIRASGVICYPFGKLSLMLISPSLHILPLHRHPSRLSAPNRPRTPFPSLHFDK